VNPNKAYSNECAAGKYDIYESASPKQLGYNLALTEAAV